MRDRLIELINQFKELDFCIPPDWWIEHFADHLLANVVIVPPCDIGTEIKGEIVHGIAYSKSLVSSGEIHITKKIYTCHKEDVENTIFCSHPMTWEEAEQALKGGEG